MKLTLYKKCILNNSYTEVFNVKKMTEKDGQQMSVLDAYLAGLDSFTYENDFIYTEQAGSFQIELYPLQNADDIYSYNYLKVEEFDDNDKTVFKRYCFVDNITKIASDVVSVYYSEDIWSSYSGTMEIRDGVITNKYRSPKVPYYLPVPYDGNDGPQFFKLDRTKYIGFLIVCQLQLYKLTEDGVPNKRLTYTVVITDDVQQTEPRGTYHTPKVFNDVQILNTIVEGMANTKISSVIGPSQTESYNYEVDNFTLVPATEQSLSFLGKCGTLGTAHYRDIVIYDIGSGFKLSDKMVTFLDLENIQGQPYGPSRRDYYFGSIPQNFKFVSFGSLLSQYEFTNNGSAIDYEVLMSISSYDFKLLLHIQNKIIDITNDFVVKMPFTSLNAEENTAKKIQREMANINGIFDIVQGVAETGVQVAGAVVSGGMSLVGGSVSNVTESAKYNYSRIDRQITSASSTRTVDRMNKPTAGGLTGGVRKIANGITELVYANKPKYSSTQGTFSTSDAVANAINGFGVLMLNSENDEFVEELLKRTGYTVFMTAKSYDEVFNATESYDVIKMSTVMLYGSFSQDINFELSEILRNGIRIFNSEDVKI